MQGHIGQIYRFGDLRALTQSKLTPMLRMAE